MEKQQTITINGIQYDARTGLRVLAEETKPGTSQKVQQDVQMGQAVRPSARYTAQSLHSKRNRRSTTLNRQHVKAPARPKAAQKEGASITVKSSVKRPTYAKHPKVYRFSNPADTSIKPAIAAPKKQVSKGTSIDIRPAPHPVHQAAIAKQSSQQMARPQSEPAHTPSSIQKQQAIEQALRSAKAANKKEKVGLIKRANRFISVASASLAVVVLAGYFTYINLPNLSVRVAAAQAGIDATYPGYRPSGYSLRGPIAHENGQVSMQFASNTGPRKFNIDQVASSWNSGALLENRVVSESNGKYQTISNGGLTIYTYGDTAVWVNGGILHTIKGDAELSTDQLRKIAESM
ncbi:hypothetical protein H6796_00250 [Candidatus Nomurabacteria bacterium]|nr:hypothetical protein [Candidatus Nomurabacteria bacterium]